MQADSSQSQLLMRNRAGMMPVALGPAARPKGFRHATRLSLLPPPDCLSRAPAASENEGKKLIVGRDIILSGRITSCDKLVVEGRVEAEDRKSTRLNSSHT